MRGGYGRHDREDAYIAADAASPAYRCPPPAPTGTGPTEQNPVRPTPGEEDSTDNRVGPRATTTQELASAYYANCPAAKAAGAAPLPVGEPGYSATLDRDGDGIACE